MAKQTNPTPAPERASTSDVTFNFVSREGGPERLVCEVEVVFPSTAGILAGLKLAGFSLWRSPEGEIYVTFPSRAFGAGAAVLRLPSPTVAPPPRRRSRRRWWPPTRRRPARLSRHHLCRRPEDKAEDEPVQLSVREARALLVKMKVAESTTDEAQALASLGR
jgi:hypothetical protein